VHATARDGSGVSDDFLLNITTPPIMVSSITVSSSGDITVLESGSTLQFSATVLPVEATNKELDWSIVNGTGTASISATGMLNAGNPGTVSVHVTARDGSGVEDTFNLVISASTIEVSSITIETEGNELTIEEGGTLQLYANVKPSNADNPDVVWHVTNATKGTGQGSVTEDGLFIAMAQGEVDVVAIAKDGSGVYDMLTLTVLGPTAIEAYESEALTLFPNPGKGLFFLDVGDLKVEELKVFNVNGGIVLDLIPEPGKQTIKIDLSQQSPGLYFIKVIFIDHTLVKQAIISN
jgi:uncharacterized protein YjdB